MTREGRIGVVQAAAATGFFSTGAILVRWAQDLSPVEVTSLRLLLGGLLVAAAARGSGERVRLALAWLLLHETPTWNAVAGAGITLVGVVLVLL